MEQNQIAETENSEMGFATMALMSFLPLLVAGIFCVSLALYALYQKTAADRICKVEAMRLQFQLAKSLTALLKLNPAARKLRIDRAYAEAAVVAAEASVNPVALAAAIAQRNAVITAQEALASQQQLLLTSARMERLAANRRFESQIGRAGLVEAHPRLTNADGLAVRPEPPMSLTPDYLPLENFSNAQAHQFDYRQNLFAGLSGIFANFLTQWRSTKATRDRCSATLANSEEKWEPVLKKVSL